MRHVTVFLRRAFTTGRAQEAATAPAVPGSAAPPRGILVGHQSRTRRPLVENRRAKFPCETTTRRAVSRVCNGSSRGDQGSSQACRMTRNTSLPMSSKRFPTKSRSACRPRRAMSELVGEADDIYSGRVFRILTRTDLAQLRAESRISPLPIP